MYIVVFGASVTYNVGFTCLRVGSKFWYKYCKGYKVKMSPEKKLKFGLHRT